MWEPVPSAPIEEAVRSFLAEFPPLIAALYVVWNALIHSEYCVTHIVELRSVQIFAVLLKVESNTRRLALIAQRARPVGMHWPCAVPTLAACDDPVNAYLMPKPVSKPETTWPLTWLWIHRAVNIHRPKQWLTTQEAHFCRHLEQFWYALIGAGLVLY